MTQTTSHDVLVIGAGVAGLAATREALRAGLTAAWLEAAMFGGLVLNVNEMDGAISGSGAEYCSNLMSEAMDLGGENLEAVATGVEPDGDGWVVTSDAGRHRARAVIVASGASLRKMGVPGEAELEHKGVAHCADCDGPMYQGEVAVVVGGGDSALQSALVLARYCSQVHLVHRGDSFRAQPHLVAAIQNAANVQVHWNSRVEEVVGTEGVEAVRVNGTDVPCMGVFAYVGLEPNTGFLPADLARDERGALVTNDSLETSQPGIFAAGAVRSGCGGMVEHAVAEGEKAGRAAAARLGALATT